MANKLSLICVILYVLAEVRGECHKCQSNFAKCHDDKRFTMCTQGISEDEMQSCPSGYVCTAEPEICLPSSAANPVQATCESGCSLCNSPDKLFACLNENTYVYCFGTDTPDYDAIGICPDGYVCNLGRREVCTLAADNYPSCYEGSSNAATTLYPPETSARTTESLPTPSNSSPNDPTSPATDIIYTSPQTSSSTNDIPNSSTQPSDSSYPVTTTSTSLSTTTEEPTTTQSTTTTTKNPRDESAFCRDKQQAGLHKSENDSSCQEYVLCYILSGQYFGIRYTCPGTTYFNDSSKQCQIAKPNNC